MIFPVQGELKSFGFEQTHPKVAFLSWRLWLEPLVRWWGPHGLYSFLRRRNSRAVSSGRATIRGAIAHDIEPYTALAVDSAWWVWLRCMIVLAALVVIVLRFSRISKPALTTRSEPGKTLVLTFGYAAAVIQRRFICMDPGDAKFFCASRQVPKILFPNCKVLLYPHSWCFVSGTYMPTLHQRFKHDEWR